MTTNTEKSFRTAKDEERAKKAAGVVERAEAQAEAARLSLAAVEEGCALDPTPEKFTHVRAARRTHEDAIEDLNIARRHAAKVEGEIAAAEREAILAEIARRAPSLPAIVNDELAVGAVAIAVACVELRSTLATRLERYLSEARELNALRARVGEPEEPVPSAEEIMLAAMREIAEPALAAQRQVGVLGSAAGWDGLASIMPTWREYFDPYGRGDKSSIRSFLPDENSSGRPEGEAQRVHALAAKLIARVRANGGKTGPTMIAGAVAKAAAVSAAVLAVATALAGHG